MRSSTTKYAATFALRMTAGILITAATTIIISSLLNRLVYGTWYVNWVLRLEAAGALTAILFALFFSAQVAEKWAAEKRKRNNHLVFPGMMWIRGIYLACVVIMIAILVGSYRQGERGGTLAFPVAIILLAYFAYPRSIRLDEVSVSQRGLLLWRAKIAYKDVEQIVFEVRRNEVTVFGKRGNRIAHTMMYVDKQRLMEQLKTVTGRSITIF